MSSHSSHHPQEVFFKGKEIEVVSMYKYLGLIFTPKLNWSVARKTLASQANKALGLLYMYNKRCGGLPVNINCELFDQIVLPILLYGAEIWGYEYCEVLRPFKSLFTDVF